MLTIDASVVVAAALRDEAAHEAAAAVLELAEAEGIAVHQPAIALVEVTAAAARRSGDRAFAHRLGARLLAMPGLTVHVLDGDAAQQAAALAAELGLRAADAIYTATASATASTLLTLDAELLARAGSTVRVVTPGEWLAAR